MPATSKYSSVRLICNPAAGGGAHDPENLRRSLSNLRPELVVTGKKNEAREAAQDWEEGLLIVAGGDGTLNEAVNGLAAVGFPEGVTLALLPAGTGNDLARTLAIPHDPEQAGEVIRDERVRTLDVARARTEKMGERFFVNAAIGGAGAEVSLAADEGLKGRWGRLSYLRASLKSAKNFRAHDLTLVLDGTERRLRAVSVAVGNCRYAGGGRLAAPQANPEDGLLDLVAIEEVGPKEILSLAPSRLTKPDYLEKEGVFFARAKEIRLDAEPPRPRFNSDGEVLGHGPAEFTVIPRALNVIVGAGYSPESENCQPVRQINRPQEAGC